MDRRRPDFPDYLDILGLPYQGTGLDVLGRSGGRRKADTVQLIEEPSIAPTGSTEHLFFVHGIRYAKTDRVHPGPEIGKLEIGEMLSIEPELDNPVNGEALQVLNQQGDRIGWIPELLLDYVRILEVDSGPRLQVVQVNGSDVPPYLRVLVRVSGQTPSGYRPFSGPIWDVMPT